MEFILSNHYLLSLHHECPGARILENCDSNYVICPGGLFVLIYRKIITSSMTNVIVLDEIYKLIIKINSSSCFTRTGVGTSRNPKLSIQQSIRVLQNFTELVLSTRIKIFASTLLPELPKTTLQKLRRFQLHQ